MSYNDKERSCFLLLLYSMVMQSSNWLFHSEVVIVAKNPLPQTSAIGNPKSCTCQNCTWFLYQSFNRYQMINMWWEIISSMVYRKKDIETYRSPSLMYVTTMRSAWTLIKEGLWRNVTSEETVCPTGKIGSMSSVCLCLITEGHFVWSPRPQTMKLWLVSPLIGFINYQLSSVFCFIYICVVSLHHYLSFFMYILYLIFHILACNWIPYWWSNRPV